MPPARPKVPEGQSQGVPGGFSVGYTGSGEGARGSGRGVRRGPVGPPGIPWVSSPVIEEGGPSLVLL